MKCKEFKEKHLLTITILIAVIAICAGIIAYKNYRDYKNFKNNKYNMAFFEVVDYMEDVETYLAKSTITKDANASGENLIQVWRETNLASAYLSQVPISVEGLSNTQKFLNQTKPKISIIMAGAGNSYGLPKQEILDRLNNIGSKIYRTDENGTITAVSDGNQIKINTEK